MHIKKAIVGLTLSMLLGNGMAAADWGDVYYCKMTHFEDIDLSHGRKTGFKLQTFQFKLDQTKNAMVFGNKSWFKDEMYDLAEGGDSPEQERWYARNGASSITYFRKGKFVYSFISPQSIINVIADCDKF